MTRGAETTIPPGAAERVARAFALPDGTLRAARLGSGHIHDTFRVEVGSGAAARRFVLQRVNTSVFPEPEPLMRNLVRVIGHIAAKLAREAAPDRERRSLALVPAREGRPFHREPEGGFWRCFHFIEGAVAIDAAPAPAQAFEAARAFGAFVAALTDLPAPPLACVIPHFHDLPRRMAALDAATGEDPLGRAGAIAAELDAARASAERLAGRLAALGAGDLPRRIVHNDCKVNNALLDARTGEGLCVIDLDTVMEGTVLADFGDLVRTAACPAPEDERDLGRVQVDLTRLEALARGYLAGAGGLLDASEVRALPLAGGLLALENAVRFLADHVAGDRYFRTHRPGHNLDRGRAQLRLAERMLEAEAEAAALVRAAAGGDGGAA